MHSGSKVEAGQLYSHGHDANNLWWGLIVGFEKENDVLVYWIPRGTTRESHEAYIGNPSSKTIRYWIDTGDMRLVF